MAEAILDLRLDTVQPNRVRLVYGVQNDYNSRYICARFTVNGKPIDIEKTAAVRINAKRPDGNKDAFPGTVNTDGTAKVPVAQWMLEVPGEVSASITAVTTSGALTTQEFYIMAKASIWDSTGEPSAENPDKDVLQTIIASENERVAAESTRVANENARKSAETVRATAETKRIADEATRVANEAERVSAESVRKAEFATWSEEVGKISAFDKRLTNLEAAISPEIVTPVTDSTVAYTKTVPKGAMPNAAVCEVGGMSYRCENLIPFPYTFGNSITTNGVTIKANADGSITLNGTFTASQVVNVELISNYIVLPAGTYRISGIPVSGNPVGFVGSLLRKDGSLETYVFYHTFTITEAKRFGLILQFAVGSSFSNQTLYPMLNKGETALPYQPYFKGLRDSKVTAIESVGTNLLNMNALDNKTTNGITFTKNSDGTYTANGTATAHVQVWLATIAANNNESLWLSGGGDGVQITVNGLNNGNFVQNIGTVNGNTMKLAQGVTYNEIEVHLVINNGKTLSNYTFYGMLNKGTTALPYTPYFRETLPIPSDALDGFGQGVNAQYCNKIVLDPLEGVKKYRQVCAKRAYEDGDENLANAITDGTKETVYELATPVETDVSHLFTDDNLLPVEAGGTITAVNEYEQAVPFTIEYTVKGA